MKRKIILTVTIITGIVTLLCISFPLIISLYIQHEFKIDVKDASAIGIIGSADGPTSILVSSINSSNLKWIFILLTALMLILTAAGTIYLKKTKNR
jgi:Na+-transporting methylmalonyl-CoA/oxaloacetate decarboxylase beta subunit